MFYEAMIQGAYCNDFIVPKRNNIDLHKLKGCQFCKTTCSSKVVFYHLIAGRKAGSGNKVNIKPDWLDFESWMNLKN